MTRRYIRWLLPFPVGSGLKSRHPIFLVHVGYATKNKRRMKTMEKKKKRKKEKNGRKIYFPWKYFPAKRSTDTGALILFAHFVKLSRAYFILYEHNRKVWSSHKRSEILLPQADYTIYRCQHISTWMQVKLKVKTSGLGERKYTKITVYRSVQFCTCYKFKRWSIIFVIFI